MRVTKNRITEFTYSNLVEDVEPWLSSNKYNKKQETLHKNIVYVYAGESETNSIETPDVSKKWVKKRPNNTLAMLDNRPKTVSKMQDKIEIEFISKGFDKLALFNVFAKKLTVVVTSIWDKRVTKTFEYSLLKTEEILTLKAYATEELKQKKTFYMDLPIIHSCKVRVIIENPNSTVQCGSIISGNSYYIGSVDWGITLGLTSYSKKDIDEFGNPSFIKRGIADADDFAVTIDATRAVSIKEKIKDFDAEFLLFTILEGNTRIGDIINFGFWETFQVLLPGPIKSEATISIQGVL